MKECPHCHEETFGFRELFLLEYFSPNECKACGKLVRNDGFRQFLAVPAILPRNGDHPMSTSPVRNKRGQRNGDAKCDSNTERIVEHVA